MMYGETCRGSADAPTYRPARICLHVQIVVLGTELIYTITQLSQSHSRQITFSWDDKFNFKVLRLLHIHT